MVRKSILLFIVLIFIGVLFHVWTRMIEPELLIKNEKTIYLDNWPQKFDGLKVVLISDLHIGLNKFKFNLKRLEKVVDLTNSENPDFIFLLGDYDSKYILKHKIDQKELSEILGSLKAKYNVISVLGNHDFEQGGNVIRKILKDADIDLLEDDYIVTDINHQSIYIVGLKDLWYCGNHLEFVLSRVKENIPIILLSHNPDVFPNVPDRVNISFAGHNHGGVFLLPFLKGIFTISNYDQRYIKGLVVENGKHFYISSGINPGFATFGNPPEVNIITLKTATKKNPSIWNTSPNTGVPKGAVSFYFKLNNYLKNLK